MTTNRIVHIDIAKAIGIMLIIASHIIPTSIIQDSTIYHWWNSALNSFYVPVFFILSGVFESSSTDIQKLKYRVFKLIKYCLIFYVFGVLSAGLILGNWGFDEYTSKTVIWFLFTLIWITILMFFIKKYSCNILLITFIIIGGGVISSYNKSYFFIGQAMLLFPFYFFGYFFKDYIKDSKFKIQQALLYLIIWLTLMIYCYSSQNVSINLVTQNYLAFYITGFSGSLLLIELCKLIHWNYLEYYGRNSIVPMMVQFVFIWLLPLIYQINTLTKYFLSAFVICILCGCCIPLFRNRKYDLFN